MIRMSWFPFPLPPRSRRRQNCARAGAAERREGRRQGNGNCLFSLGFYRKPCEKDYAPPQREPTPLGATASSEKPGLYNVYNRFSKETSRKIYDSQ